MAIVLNGSPLFSGGAGGGESNIRKWLLDNDLVDAIIGLPKDMFYNTGISTYVWVLTNRKAAERQGKVQLIDARERFGKLRKSIGSKRLELRPEDIAEIVRDYAGFADSKTSKVFRTEDFLYRTITVERPEMAEDGTPVLDKKSKPKADPKRRDTENVPWTEDVQAYFEREVLPYAPDAWVDEAKTKEGAEIPFTRHFYEYVPPRPLEEIDSDLNAVMAHLRVMLEEVER
jgi:type I restriction enzyme M protein